jgi:hypothetical protein
VRERRVSRLKRSGELQFHRLQVKQLYQDLELAPDSKFSGSYLMNREAVGVPIRRALAEVFISLPNFTVLAVDFAGVMEMTGSVAEEIGPGLFRIVEEERSVNPEKYLIYDRLAPDILRELDAWFAKHSRCVPAIPDQHACEQFVIGALPPKNLLNVLEYCYQHGSATSEALELAVPAASKKLTDLYKQYPWLVHRQKVSGEAPRSWHHVFTSLAPPQSRRSSVCKADDHPGRSSPAGSSRPRRKYADVTR